MTSLGAWLLGLVTPLVGRVLMALGFQVVSIVGVVLVVNQVKAMAIGYFAGIPTMALQFLLLGGLAEGLGIIFGAVATRIALWQIQNAVKVLGVAS